MLQTFHFLYITLSVQSDFLAPHFAVLFFAQILAIRQNGILIT